MEGGKIRLFFQPIVCFSRDDMDDDEEEKEDDEAEEDAEVDPTPNPKRRKLTQE